jgi:cell division protein FtsB
MAQLLRGVKKMYKRKKSRMMLLLMILILGYFIYVAVNQQNVLNIREAEKRVVESKINSELKLNSELKVQKKDINSDGYVEKIAREKLGMVKNGEKVFVDINR